MSENLEMIFFDRDCKRRNRLRFMVTDNSNGLVVITGLGPKGIIRCAHYFVAGRHLTESSFKKGRTSTMLLSKRE